MKFKTIWELKELHHLLTPHQKAPEKPAGSNQEQQTFSTSSTPDINKLIDFEEPSYCSVETQTDNYVLNTTTTDCQTEETRLPPKSATVVLLDHSYCSKVEEDPVGPETHQQEIKDTGRITRMPLRRR